MQEITDYSIANGVYVKYMSLFEKLILARNEIGGFKDVALIC